MLFFKKKSLEANTENRRAERLKPEDDFFVEFRSNPDEKIRLGQGKDISLNGVRFATAAPVEAGDELEMTLYFPKAFPGPRKVETHAVVHRVHDPGPQHRLRAACEFFPSGSVLEKALSSYLEWAKTQDLTPVE